MTEGRPRRGPFTSLVVVLIAGAAATIGEAATSLGGDAGEMTARHDASRTAQHTRSAPKASPRSSGSDDLGRKENAMAIDQVDRTVVTQEPATAAGQQTVQTDRRLTTTTGPGGAELIRRIVILLFGLVQIVIGARIVLLLLDAREANALVSAILDASQVFVAPFNGILNTDSLHAAGSTLDLAAILAFVGWTILELIVLWAVGIFRREPANTSA